MVDARIRSSNRKDLFSAAAPNLFAVSPVRYLEPEAGCKSALLWLSRQRS